VHVRKVLSHVGNGPVGGAVVHKEDLNVLESLLPKQP